MAKCATARKSLFLDVTVMWHMVRFLWPLYKKGPLLRMSSACQKQKVHFYLTLGSSWGKEILDFLRFDGLSKVNSGQCSTNTLSLETRSLHTCDCQEAPYLMDVILLVCSGKNLKSKLPRTNSFKRPSPAEVTKKSWSASSTFAKMPFLKCRYF